MGIVKESTQIRIDFLDSTDVVVYSIGFDETKKDVPDGVYKAIAYVIDGYEFDSLSCKGGNLDGEYISYKFIVSDDKLAATFDNFKLGQDDGIFITATFYGNDTVLRERENPLPSYLGFNHVYQMSPQQLIDFSKERFVGGTSKDAIDLGQYVINVLELPFKFDESLLGSLINIIVGNVNMKTQGVEVLNDEIRVNIGNIIIPSVYDNAYDFINTTTIIHLPFSRSVELPTEYVINQTITVEYVINLYTGDTTLNVLSTKIDDVIFYTDTFKLGRNIPFIKNSGSNELIGQQQPSTPINNYLFNAYVEVIRNKPYQIDSSFNKDSLVQDYLKNVKGYVEVVDINLDSLYTIEESSIIMNKLNEGVYIK